jgi:hypothetical protein
VASLKRAENGFVIGIGIGTDTGIEYEKLQAVPVLIANLIARVTSINQGEW